MTPMGSAAGLDSMGISGSKDFFSTGIDVRSGQCHGSTKAAGIRDEFGSRRAVGSQEDFGFMKAGSACVGFFFFKEGGSFEVNFLTFASSFKQCHVDPSIIFHELGRLLAL